MCLSTWSSTSLRQLGAVPISFLQGAPHVRRYVDNDNNDKNNKSNADEDNTRATEESHMIYNHRTYFSGQEDIDSGFTQVYLF